MTRHKFLKALTFGLAASALIFTGCETTENRISDHPDIFNSLSPGDQALVREGKIRSGMPTDAVWLAWGSPDQKTAGEMRGRTAETWIYTQATVAPYGSAYYPYYGYGPGFYGGFGGGFGGGFRHHGGRSFAFFGDPFYDPFYYSYIPSVIYPYKTVTFANGRVMSFQYLVPAYR